MIKKLASHLGEYKRAAIITPLLSALEAIMDVLLPLLMSYIIDQGIEKGDMDAVIKYGLLTFLVAAIALVLGLSAGRFAAKASAGYAGNLRDAMFERIQHYSFTNIDKFSTAGLVTRMTTDVTNVQNAFQMLMRMCVRAPVHLVFALIMSVMINPHLTGIFLVAMLFLLVVLGCIMLPTTKIFDRVFRNYDNLNASVQENVTAIRVVKSFVREKHEDDKYTKACQDLYNQFVKAESRLSFNNPSMLVAIYGCNLALSWFGAHYVLDGVITTGQLNALFGYVMNILASLMMLSMVFVMLSMSVASCRRIIEVLDEKTDLPPAQKPVDQVQDGSVEFDHVTFKYKHGTGSPVLSDITFRIRPGETLGVIGGTGSAKSSLVQLIPRLYDVDSGAVRVGGVDVRDYNLDVLRQEVSMVLQKNVLFSGTILNNLRWGDENATEEECMEACRLACADEFIQRFPDKYNTWIEQGGTNVSGGQKQRLCIARALLRKPKILILDDSTSAVDTATDAKIRQAFREKLPGTTRIIIAQRISSVQDADRILVLDNGRIDGLGTHEELLATNKIYQEVYNSQTQGGGDFDKQGGED
ncbi:MAG TPA: ABC transporter ATP-binding protein/permease [Candidatus Faecalibacterium avium]|nr:ABC transporter ATP-binding protein/permease [Candidatus Faecalibacterium avium]